MSSTLSARQYSLRYLKGNYQNVYLVAGLEEDPADRAGPADKVDKEGRELGLPD